MVSLHHNIGANPDWDEFTKIIGGKFIFKEMELEGQPYTPSTWSHGEDLKVHVVPTSSTPSPAAWRTSKIHDEPTAATTPPRSAKLLLKTDHPKNDPELAWATSTATAACST